MNLKYLALSFLMLVISACAAPASDNLNHGNAAIKEDPLPHPGRPFKARTAYFCPPVMPDDGQCYLWLGVEAYAVLTYRTRSDQRVRVTLPEPSHDANGTHPLQVELGEVWFGLQDGFFPLHFRITASTTQYTPYNCNDKRAWKNACTQLESTLSDPASAAMQACKKTFDFVETTLLAIDSPLYEATKTVASQSCTPILGDCKPPFEQ